MSVELIDQYEAGASKLAMGIRGLTREDLSCFPVPGTWSIQQIAVHLADCELVFADRIKRTLAEAPTPSLLAFDENRWMAALATDDRSAEDAAAMVELARKDVTRILRAQPAEIWSRVGRHSQAGELTLAAIVKKANDHLDHHLKFLHDKRAKLGKAMW